VTTATLTGPLVSPSGQTLTRRKVTAELVSAPGTAGHHSTGEIMERHTVVSDNAGQFSIALPLNSEIDPPGTFWRVVCGRYSWLVALDIAGTWTVGDKAIQVLSPEPPGWVPLAGPAGEIAAVAATALPPGSPPTVTNAGTPTAANLTFGLPAGEPGAVPPSTVAARPAATTVPGGALHFATDLNGGQATVSDGSSWQPAAPSLNTAFGGRHLGGAQLATNQTNVGQAAATDVAGMTVTFTSTGGPVLLVVSALFTQLRRTTWTPVAGTLKSPSLLIVVDGSIVVGMAGADTDVAVVPTTGTGRTVAATLTWPVFGLAAASHTVKLKLPKQEAEYTWGVSQGLPTFGTPATRLDVIQLSA